MAENSGKKKKLKLSIKTKSKGSGIAAQIAQRQKEKKSLEEEQKKQALLKKKESLLAEKKKTSTIASKTEAPKKSFKTTFEEPAARNKVPEAAPRSKKDKKSHKNSGLREDILKQEEHKKFFLKQQNQRRPAKERLESGVQSSSIPKSIKITEYIQVGELARKLHVKTSELIGKFMKMGEMVTITQSVDAETVSLIAAEYGCEVNVISLYDETTIQEDPDDEEKLETRPPVVTIMGHVDHGKTKLLDAFRETDVVSGEAGGITQHIGAYQISGPKGKITFLDTPGHEAFSAMRARGANLTDIVVLVVAADDGVMPQTVEAIQHAKEAKVPIIVAINKIDKEGANAEKIRQEVSKYDLVPEEWGGKTTFVEVSALKKTNLDKLLDLISASAELLELKADPTKKPYGTVIEARLDQGRGPVVTILVTNGTLKVGDPYVVGVEGGKVRAMQNDKGSRIKEATPGTPVEIIGLSGVPNAGDPFHVLNSDKEVKRIVEKRQELNRQQQAQKIKKVKLENLSEIIKEGELQELKVIIKADVQGSVEALKDSLEKLSNSEIRVNVIFSGAGEIVESDIMLASASNALVIGFHTRANARVREVASNEGIEIRYFNIIYQVIDDISKAMSGMLSPDFGEEILGEAEVRQLFKISSLGTIAGCMVKSGKIIRSGKCRVIRDGVEVYSGDIKALKRFQDDASEVKEGFECGILVEGYNDLKEADVIECFEIQEIERSMDDIKKESTSDSEASE